MKKKNLNVLYKSLKRRNTVLKMESNINPQMSLKERLEEQRELYLIYKDEHSRELISIFANKIKKLIKKEGEIYDK